MTSVIVHEVACGCLQIVCRPTEPLWPAQEEKQKITYHVHLINAHHGCGLQPSRHSIMSCGLNIMTWEDIEKHTSKTFTCITLDNKSKKELSPQSFVCVLCVLLQPNEVPICIFSIQEANCYKHAMIVVFNLVMRCFGAHFASLLFAVSLHELLNDTVRWTIILRVVLFYIDV
jgi:hypothetical protein